MQTRRDFIALGIASAALGGCKLPSQVGLSLHPWQPGELDIHLIHTGVGEQTFFIFPDGTTMLLDCGDTHHAKYMKDIPPRPTNERFGGEWVSRYIQRLIKSREIDYAMISHWHGDHTGDLDFGGKRTSDGRIVNGMPLVGEDFKFNNFIDHQYPEMGQHALDPDPGSIILMREWLHRIKAAGTKMHKFEVGALNQIRLLKDPARYPSFEIRNIAANGVLWDGKGGTHDAAAIHVKKTGVDAVHENLLSSAIRLRYGNFSYYSGGDNELFMIGADGKEFNWEACIGKVVGPVDVCKTNHHAGSAGMSADFVREVRAQAYLSSVWQSRMVDHKSLSSMCSRILYPGERIVCFGDIASSHRSVAEAYGSDIPPPGHAVVRVAPGGDTFRVFTLSTHDESMTVLFERQFISNPR
ncbi:MAG: MBL fold metallo-hydrolase [Kiritimatiellae bacterium]|nr:MBL fold metallo-hydrolase [Kiritimatiellia bacterium]